MSSKAIVKMTTNPAPESRQLMLDGPEPGEMRTGMTIQGNVDDIKNLAEVRYTDIINKNIRTALSHKKSAEETLRLAREAVTKAEEAYKVPGEFLTNLMAVRDAIRLFVPKAESSKARREADAYSKDLNYVDLQFDGAKHEYTAVGHVYHQGTVLFAGRQTFKYEAPHVKLIEAVREAEKKVQATENRLKELQAEKAAIPQLGRETAAAVTEHNLRNSGGAAGNELLEKILTGLSKRAKANGLNINSDEEEEST